MMLLVNILLFMVLGGLSAPTIHLDYDPMEIPDMFEGDIETYEDDTDRSAVVSKKLLWTDGVIPFVLDNELNETVKHTKIYAAINELNNKTCLKFIPRTKEKDYVRFITGVGCHTTVGSRGGEHKITLGPGCGLIGSIMHEIGHAIGFFHEHNRSDRHKYIKILWENIKQGKESQFKQRIPGSDLLLTPFDYDSIMLYGSTFFSKDRKKLKTMVSLTNQKFPDVRHRLHLSKVDILRINKLYNCA